MKSARMLSFTVLFATTTVFGQGIVLERSPSLSSSPMGTTTADCPVGLQVDHGPSTQMREVAGGRQTVLEQRIHLTMTNLHLQKIVSAQLTAHGFSQKPRVMEVSNPVADMAKQIQLALEIRGKSEASSDLTLSQFAAVTSVEVNAVTYADGSSWQEPSPGACSVAPSGLMRVSAGR